LREWKDKRLRQLQVCPCGIFLGSVPILGEG
jgi:hypothetical protein